MVKPPVIVWERISEAPRRRRAVYAKIAAAATALADKGGLETVSIRNLAQRLQSGAMSLYRYVSSKDDLWDLMLDASFGEIALPAKTSRNWRRDVIQVAIETRRMMLRHPWLAGLVTARPTLGPNYLRWFEFLLKTTSTASADIHVQVRVIGAVWAYTSGFVGHELGEQATNRRIPLTEAQKRASVEPYLQQLLATGKFPHLAEFIASHSAGDPDEEFEFGLRALLKGLSDT
jgi:AcrR family transcriptional regulator